MRTIRFAKLLVVLAAIALAAGLPGRALADGPTEAAAPTTIQAQGTAEQVPGERTVILSARLLGDGGQPLRDRPVVFYILTNTLGERLMLVGEARTDASGLAVLSYEPSWSGERAVVASFAGDERAAATLTSFPLSVQGVPTEHENAQFGLEPIRRWLPFAVGIAVLGVWGVLGFIMARTVFGLPNAAMEEAPAATRAPAFLPPPRLPPFARALLPLVALVLLAAPAAWVLRGQLGGRMPLLSTNAASFLYEHGQVTREEPAATAKAATLPQRPISATLVRNVPTLLTDAGGQLTPASANLPADLAVFGEKLFVIDTNRGRLLRVTPEGQLSPILETARDRGLSLRGAVAMDSHDGSVYVANYLAGNVVVIETSGQVKGIITPRLPNGSKTFLPAGIAVTPDGQVWLSDSENQRVVLIDYRGELLASIGESEPGSPDSLGAPAGLALDRLGNLFVVDSADQVVRKYSPGGDLLMTAGEGYLVQPQAVAIDAAGNIYVTDSKQASVAVFAPGGDYIGSIGARGTAASASAQLQDPRGLKIDGNDLYVMDRLGGLLVFRIPSAWARR